MADPRLVPEPSIFVLYGATGDLAHRLVLPAFYQLAIAGLLPQDWRLVGNGRGDVSHEDFQERVRQSLEEFGPKPAEGPWDEFRSRLCFAGGGFDSSDPGTLLDVLKGAEAQMGGRPQLIHYMAVPPAAFGPLTEAIGAHGLADGFPRGLRKAVRDVVGIVRGARPHRRCDLRRVADLPYRPFSGQGGNPGHPCAAFRQRPLRRCLGQHAHRERPDRRARDAGRGHEGLLLRSPPAPFSTCS